MVIIRLNVKCKKVGWDYEYLVKVFFVWLIFWLLYVICYYGNGILVFFVY